MGCLVAQPLGIGWSFRVSKLFYRYSLLDLLVIAIPQTKLLLCHLVLVGTTSRPIMVIIIDVMGSYGEQPRGSRRIAYFLGVTCRVKPTDEVGIQSLMM